MGVTVTSTTFAFLGSCPDSFVLSSPYGLGTKVQVDGIVYECISDYDCGGFAFDPGSSSYGDLWREKWTMVGSCDQGTTSPTTSTPSHQPTLSPSTYTPSTTLTTSTSPTETKQPLSTSQTATSVQFSYEEFDSTSQTVDVEIYQGPAYEFTPSVRFLKRLPRLVNAYICILFVFLPHISH